MDTKVQAIINTVGSQHPFGVSSFMHTLDLEAMNVPKFSVLANQDGEFAIGIEFSFRKVVVTIIRNYTISKGVKYKNLGSVVRVDNIPPYRGSEVEEGVKIMRQRNVVRRNGVGIISDRYDSISATMAKSNGHCWGHITTNLVKCINSMLKGERNIPVTALIRATYYHLNELFTRKRAEAQERITAEHAFSKFATAKLQTNLHASRSIQVYRFDK
ncbi:hypothetical protein Ahy_A06g029542 [Arachis hypogaea]|uniref:Uncharacterized protein n=1 Tax=Arachis hypogaea TaxID=3818 RepID=A0A445CTM4_ARAHY|nr:hypothetical protein Ahy_A06g029542 [Arachis hypogaea]